MINELRQTGLDIIGDIPWGTHLCQFYRTREDLLDILVPYFRAGLENDEFCMWVTSEPLGEQQARQAMREAVPDFDRYLKRGQIEIVPHTEWYLKGGAFNSQRVLDGWVDKLNQALARGYDGLRLTGNTFWLEKSDWKGFTDYEKTVDSVIGDHRMLAVCTYSLDKCDASLVIDVVNNHRFAIIRREGKWDLIESAGRKQAENGLHATEVELAAILENVPMLLLLVDKDRRVLKINHASAEFADRPIEEMIGLRAGEALRCLHSLDDPRGCGFGTVCETCVARRTVLDAIETGQGHYQVECKLTFAVEGKQEEMTFLLSTVRIDLPKREEVLVCLEDITERKRAEEALRQSEADYRILVESCPDGIFALDAEGCVVDCNESLCQLLDHDRSQVRGKNIRTFLSSVTPLDAATLQARLNSIRQLEMELEVLRQDGQATPVWAKLAAFQGRDNDTARIVGYVRDVSQRKKLEELKDEFIGLVSHEIRTPLTVIRGAVKTALDEQSRLSRKEMRQLLQDAAAETETLSNLIWNLLELSRAQAQRLLLNTEAVNLNAVVRRVVDRIRQQSSAHRFVTDFPEELSPVNADPIRVERILYNLLENAVKYSPQGGEIRVFAKQEADGLLVGVSDQGIGISGADRVRLFKPFERLDDRGRKQFKGAGLGLLVCRRLVEAHGGRIWLESEPGRGSTFFFTLPCKPGNGQ